MIVNGRNTFRDVYTPILMTKPKEYDTQVRNVGYPSEDTVPRSSLKTNEIWNEDDRPFSKSNVNDQTSPGHHYTSDTPFSSKPQDARRVQNHWPDNVYQKTYGRPPPQHKNTSFSSMFDAHDTSENMTNYWSSSSVKTNHHSVLSSQ